MALQDINEVLNTGVMILIFFILGMIFVRLSKVFEIVEILRHKMNEHIIDFDNFKRDTRDSLVHIRYDLAEIKTRTKMEDGKDVSMDDADTIREKLWDDILSLRNESLCKFDGKLLLIDEDLYKRILTDLVKCYQTWRDE